MSPGAVTASGVSGAEKFLSLGKLASAMRDRGCLMPSVLKVFVRVEARA